MLFIIPFFMEFVFIIVFVFVIGSIIKRSKNTKDTNVKTDKSSETLQNTISNANDENDYWNSISSKETHVYCDYCGSKLERVRKRCPSCGAKVNKTDK